MIGRFFSRRDDRKFGEDLRSNLIRLFSEHSARVVSNDDFEYRGKRSFDYAVANVSTPDLDLRFVRVRGQFEVYISIPNMRRWDSLTPRCSGSICSAVFVGKPSCQTGATAQIGGISTGSPSTIFWSKTGIGSKRQRVNVVFDGLKS